MNIERRFIIFILALLVCPAQGQGTDGEEKDIAIKLQRYLERYPASDADGDGVLTMEEFRKYRKTAGLEQNAESKLKLALERFPQADADRNGVLSLDEWRGFQSKRQELLKQRQRDVTKGRTKPTHADVDYGDHSKQRFDLWTVVDAKQPTPLVIYIHGGGFRGGDKAGVRPEQIAEFRNAGVAFASLNYRLSDSGPYPIMMHDAALALQTIRHDAKRYNIDPNRIACFGGSAGAGISLWLAFHDDLADPTSGDPIRRQSTRILAAGTLNGQSSYDMHTYRQWFSVSDLPMHDALPAFLGIDSEEELDEDSVRKKMRDASPITHLSSDDTASVYMVYSRANTRVTKSTSQGEWVHHVLLGLKLKEAMKKRGLECHVTGPDQGPESKYGSLEKFLIQKVTTAENPTR